MARRKRRPKKRGIIHIHDCTEALELERGAYYGGRCDVFRYGHVAGPIFQLDVNSLYPSVMLANTYPVSLLGVEQGPTIERLHELLQSYLLCAHVRIRSGRRTYPFRDRLGSRMVLGIFDTYLTTPELIAALRAGHVEQCYSASYYERADIFSQWVDALYSRRLACMGEGNRDAGLVYKLLLNSLYGKWGQHGTTWAECDTVRPVSMWGIWSAAEAGAEQPSTYRSIGGIVECELRDGEWLHSSPAIAAHVTAYGRERLRELITTAGVSNVYYTDTDSLHVNRNGLVRLGKNRELSATRLGRLRCEATYPEAEYKGRRNYRVGSKCVFSGAQLDPASYSTRRVQADRTERVRHTLDLGPSEHVVHHTVDLDLSRHSLRGAIMPDGRVIPEVVGDEPITVDDGAL